MRDRTNVRKLRSWWARWTLTILFFETRQERFLAPLFLPFAV